MLSFYLILLGTYLYYSKSKYFPNFLFRPSTQIAGRAGLLCIIIGSALYIKSDDLAAGLLLSLAVCMLAMALVQLFAVLGKIYFYGLVTIVHILLVLDLLIYAR